MTNLDAVLVGHAKMIAANGRFFAILVASLHDAGIINGRAIAQSIRLDRASDEMYRLGVADRISSYIDECESQQFESSGLRPVE
ncbi:hypothetical protein [Blastomonas sp. CCH1-A6]|uniref:hypothetical protein n=1 Tax=Blastomonas sp. CCH1-A6 TaxID=1768762 RepID=UPI0008369752